MRFRTPFSGIESLACLAVPSSNAVPSVVLVIRMAFRAMSFAGHIQATIAAKCVYLMRNCFKMERIDTVPNAAQMVDLQSFWDGTVMQFVSNPMRSYSLALDTCVSISVRSARTYPKYAPGVRFWDAVFFKALGYREAHSFYFTAVAQLGAR